MITDVKTNICGCLFEIRATGDLAEQLARCKTAEDVLAVLGAYLEALRTIDTANSHTDATLSAAIDHDKAVFLVSKTGQNSMLILALRKTLATVVTEE